MCKCSHTFILVFPFSYLHTLILYSLVLTCWGGGLLVWAAWGGNLKSERSAINMSSSCVAVDADGRGAVLGWSLSWETFLSTSLSSSINWDTVGLEAEEEAGPGGDSSGTGEKKNNTSTCTSMIEQKQNNHYHYRTYIIIMIIMHTRRES